MRHYCKIDLELALIEVQNLNVYSNKKALLENITLTLDKNRSLGIVGKSGAGKSLFAKSLIYLLDKSLEINADKLSVLGDLILQLNKKDLRSLRKKVGFIFQDARMSFHSAFNIGDIFEMHLKESYDSSKKERKNLVFLWLERLNIKDKELIWHSFIHQLSAGIAMRVQIALALSLGAEMLLCDEITSSLDEANTNNIIEIFKGLKTQKSLVLISHELGFIEALSDEIAVFENGKIIEKSNAKDFFTTPKSAYSKEILKIYKDNYAPNHS